MKKGKVEKGNSLNKIKNEINEFYGTNLTVEDLQKINQINDRNKIEVDDIVVVGMIQQDGEIWVSPYNREEITEQYLSQNTQGERDRILDYHRFVFEDDDLPTTREELLRNEKDLWKGGKIAPAHNVGTTGNIEYRGIGRRAGQQIIFDPNGNIVTTPENKGTYDYIVPRPISYISLKNHNYYDVNPWIRYGNSAKDITTEQQRRDSLRESKIGQIGNTLWGAR